MSKQVLKIFHISYIMYLVMNMKFTFYGTSAAEGVPALYCECNICTEARKRKGKDIRTRSQSMINDDLLIDYPPDTYLHALNYGLPLHKIKNVLITHPHSDHLYLSDITMIRPGFSNLKDNSPLNIYGSISVVENLRSSEIICEMESRNQLVIHEVKAFVPFFVDEYRVTPLEADHAAPLVSFIYLIEKDGKTVLYAHDTGYFPESTMTYLSETKPTVDFATFDCCYSLRHKDKGHMGFDEVRTMRERLEGIGVINENTVCCVNHFSHNNGEFYEDMKKHSEKYGFLTSYDGMEIEI